MKYEPRFDVVYNKDVYTFLESLPQKTQDKIASNIDKSRYVIDSELFKKLKGEIWEFRTIHNNTCIRLLAFWDKEQKKSGSGDTWFYKEIRKDTTTGDKKSRVFKTRVL